jgi:hypothetical protein
VANRQMNARPNDRGGIKLAVHFRGWKKGIVVLEGGKRWERGLRMGS